jgi:hypothetical protein
MGGGRVRPREHGIAAVTGRVAMLRDENRWHDDTLARWNRSPMPLGSHRAAWA